MNIGFLVPAVILITVINGTTALSTRQSFSDVDSITNYLKNQSLEVQQSFSSFVSKQIQVGNRTIMTRVEGSESRIFGNDIILIFHKDGTITYDVNGESKPMVTVRAGEFQIDDEIFELVFPGFSMDITGNKSTTIKQKDDLKEMTTPVMTPIRTTTSKTSLPHTGSTSSAQLGKSGVFMAAILTSLGLRFLTK